jgi:hypothetical protein
VEWALLEACAHNLLRRLLGLENDHESYLAIQPRTAKSLFEAIGRVAKRKLDKEKAESLRKTLKAIERDRTGVLARRNRVNHSIWLHPGAAGVPSTKKSTDLFVDAIEVHRTFPLDELSELADEIEKRCWEIIFLRQIYKERSADRTSRRK